MKVHISTNRKHWIKHIAMRNGITLRCSQPWFVGVLGGPVVPAHQPRQIQRPTVSTSWNRGFAVRPQSKRATGVLCVEENNSSWEEERPYQLVLRGRETRTKIIHEVFFIKFWGNPMLPKTCQKTICCMCAPCHKQMFSMPFRSRFSRWVTVL